MSHFEPDDQPRTPFKSGQRYCRTIAQLEFHEADPSNGYACWRISRIIEASTTWKQLRASNQHETVAYTRRRGVILAVCACGADTRQP